MQEPNWGTHDFLVKMLDWSAVRGSRLAYTCRRCGRGFCRFSLSRDLWAIDGDGHSLDNLVSNRWFSEQCPRSFLAKDDEDRKQLSKSAVN
jgi:hypothetical protein